MQNHTIQAEARSGTGKGLARKLRADGKIPAVAYGGGKEGVSLTIPAKQLQLLKKADRGWNTPVTIEVDGGETIPVAVLKDVQRHPVTGRVLHADFQLVEGDAKVLVRVPVSTTGKAAGAAMGGSIRVSLREIELLCAPADIPKVLEIDVTPMNIGDTVLLQDLPMPKGCKVASRHNPPILACVGKRGAKVVEETEDEEGEEAEE